MKKRKRIRGLEKRVAALEKTVKDQSEIIEGLQFPLRGVERAFETLSHQKQAVSAPRLPKLTK